MGRATAAAQAAAPPVKEGQADAMLVTDLGQVVLRHIEHPVGAQKAAIFVGIAIADHNLLVVAALGQMLAIDGVGKQFAHDRRCILQIFDGFKERCHVQLADQVGIVGQ